jgi:3'(2'), 5'-bisphosphate nucleotidase
MDDNLYNTQLIDELIAISKEAGEAILEVYNSDFDYEIKKDSSPLTKADNISHKIISKKLKELTPEIPILSEEDSDIPFGIRSKWQKYWLVDPLDGTKEFIKRNGEFTVNIALIENNSPILGIIYIPISCETFYGSKNNGSYYFQNNNQAKRINISDSISKTIRVISSRSHPNKKVNSFLEGIQNYKIITKGSSLKFCFIASGKADIYPRFGPTSEWDTAAGDAIVRYSGGHVLNLKGEPLSYNLKKTFLNPEFIVTNDKKEALKLIDLIKNH